MNPDDNIARLPDPVRHRLNHRLQEDEPVPDLVAWLNADPSVKSLLEKKFAGAPIVESDLRAWRQGGYLAWRAEQETLAIVHRCRTQATEILQSSRGALADQVAQCLIAQIAGTLWDTSPPDESDTRQSELSPGSDADDAADAMKKMHHLVTALVALRRGGQISRKRRLQREKLDAKWREFKKEQALLRHDIRQSKKGFKDIHITDEERETLWRELRAM